MNYQRWNTFNINKVHTKFNNTGMLCDGNNQNFTIARKPSLRYPGTNGFDYGTCVAVVVGAPAEQDAGTVGGANPENLPYLDGAMDEGPADFWNEEHFAPYPEFINPQDNRAAMSDSSHTWPTPWPSYYPGSTDPILIGSDGWPGFGKNGEKVAEQESFSVMYAWGGTDNFDNAAAPTRWLKTQLICRGLAWTGSLYEDFIVWVFVVRNIGTAPIVDMRMGIHLDLGFLPSFLGPNYDDDRHYYDPNLQLAYGWDDNSYEETTDGQTLGADDIAWGGVVAIKMPGISGRVESYDATHFWAGQTTPSGSGGQPEMYYKWNLLNLDDPQDSNGDHIDDDFDENGIPDIEEGAAGYYVGSGADGLQIMGSGPFTLLPNETDTMIIAVVFGDNQNDLFNNAKRAKNLYESNWEVIQPPPAPVVEGFANDRKVTLAWSTDSEKDPQFQGYKIYRSADGGNAWGSENFTDFDGTIHYLPLEQYDLQDSIMGYYQTLPEFAWFYLGSDKWNLNRNVVQTDSFTYFNTGDTVNMFIDRDVVNGLKYRYYVAAYDSGNAIWGPLENTPSNFPNMKNNTVELIPSGAFSRSNLDHIKVVPNPYVIANSWEWGQEHQLQFIHLPESATIRIYNSSGEFVRKIVHRIETSPTGSICIWDLKNYNQQLAAPGLYFYHIETDLGSTTGKFVIIL